MNPKIIFDTDMDTDCDDAFALGLLLKYVKEQKAELLGVVADSPVKEAAMCCEAICNRYGVNVPIGAVDCALLEDRTRFSRYIAHRAKINPARYYNRVLALRARQGNGYEDAAGLYKRLLEEQEDNSVTVVCVGLLTALDAFLENEENRRLFSKKVKAVVSMGVASYPQTEICNFNYRMDYMAANRFFARCPVSVYVSSEGTDVITGGSFSSRYEKDHPLRIAYETYLLEENKGRSSWDIIAVLFALGYDSELFTSTSYGQISYLLPDKTLWREKEIREDYLVSLNISDEEMSNIIEGKI